MTPQEVCATSRPPLHVVIPLFAYLPSQMTRQTAALATSDVVSARVAMAQQLADYKSEIFMANWDTPSVLEALAWSSGSTSSVCTCHLRTIAICRAATCDATRVPRSRRGQVRHPS